MRGFVFIDGSNFYFKLKQLSGGIGHKVNLLDFNFLAFAQWLVASQQLSGVRYYIGAVKQDGSEKRGGCMPTSSACSPSSIYRASRRCSTPNPSSRPDLS